MTFEGEWREDMKIAKELREMMEAELAHGLPGWFRRDFVDALYDAAPWMLTILERIEPVCCLTCADYSECAREERLNNGDSCGRHRDIPGAPGSEEGKA